MADGHAEFRESVKTAHDFGAWMRRASAVGGPLIRRFLVAAAGLAGFEFEKREPVAGAGADFVGYCDYYRSTRDKNVVLAVTVIPYPSVHAAHEALIDILATCMAPRLIHAEERGVRAGHVGFVGHGELIDAIYFVRHNVLVRIDNVGKTRISIKDVAEEIDRRLVAHRDSP